MIRVLGVLCGAAIATALLTWLVGVPQFTSEREAASEPLAVVSLRDTPVVEAPLADPPDAEPPATPEQQPVQPVQPVQSAEPPSLPEPDVNEAFVATPLPLDDADPEPFAENRALPDPQWFAFWTPFRSEIAANGFVGRLQSVTGLDYRVVKVKPGVYEVAFAYMEDAEIDSNLSTISAATGLDLPGTP